MERQALIQKAENMRQSSLSFFVRNGHLSIITLLACVIGGGYALSLLPVESSPEVKIPIGIVSVPYPGASPGDVEKLVTDELEDVLKNLENLKTLTSTSTEGMSSITVEFEASADIDESIRELRDEVDANRSKLPAQAEDPIVTEVRADDRAIITFTMIGSQPLEEFKKQADNLEGIIEGIKGVNKVNVSGLPQREMQVLVSLQKLEGFGLSITDVSRAVSSNHIDFPVGSILTDDFYYQASLKAELRSPEELQSLAIASRNGQPVYLRDIAEVRYAFAEQSTHTTLYTAESKQYQNAVSLGVYKKTGEDLVRMTDNAKIAVEEFAKNLPSGMQILVTDDESDRIAQDIAVLLRSAWQTILIIAITLYLALGIREAAAAASAIPILYLITAMGLVGVGETFNFLTFFALILSLGVVIDTSIVIIEGIHENMNKHSMDPEEAALASVASFKAPLVSGTMTTIAAFLPLGLMTGIMGEYVKHIPITVNLTLIASLFTALMLMPPVAVWILKRSKGEPKKPILANQFERLAEWYGRNIKRILHSRKERRRWLWAMVVAFFLSGTLFAFGIVKFNLFASQDINLFFVNIAAPEGTALDRTKEITKDIEKIVEDTPELIRFVTVVGGGGFNDGFGGGAVGASHKASITVTLTDPADRKIKSYDIARDLRKELRVITEAEVLVEELSGGPPSGADIEMRLIGDDMRTVQEFAAVAKAELKKVEGTSDVTDNLELSPGEYHLTPKRDRLEFFGMTAQDLGSIMRTSVFGDNNSEIRRSGEEEDIVIRIDYRDRLCLQDPLTQLLETRDAVTICRSNPEDITEILSMQIPTPSGEQVLLSEFIDVELMSAVTTIRHYNSNRVVNVSGSVEEGYVLSDVLQKFNKRLEAVEIPEGVQIQFGGENEDTAESMASLGRASIVAMLLIFVILVYQFKSFRQVFIVLSTMPLAVMGVLYGLAILRLPLSFPGMIGMVALLGIVVNDAIVLIDKINQNREFTDNIPDAVETGCKQRLQPVIMTTLTTALGVIPLIFTGETFRDLAIVMAIGIVIATIFTLVIVPVLYVWLEHGINEPSDPECKRFPRLCTWLKKMRLKVWPPYTEGEEQKSTIEDRAARVNNMQEL
jgi:multidrug efflux pump subunit AcrB